MAYLLTGCRLAIPCSNEQLFVATNQELDYQDLAGEVYLTVSSFVGPTGTSGKASKLVLEKAKNVK